jgi:hypothetical protein
MRKKFRINYLFFSDLETDIKPTLKASLDYKKVGADFAVVLEVNVGLYGYCRERSNEQC